MAKFMVSSADVKERVIHSDRIMYETVEVTIKLTSSGYTKDIQDYEIESEIMNRIGDICETEQT